MEILDLCHFGWDGCTVPTNLKNICDKLPGWKNLKIMRSPIEMEGRNIYLPYKFIRDSHGRECMPGYFFQDIVDDGGYAIIHRVQRAVYYPSDSARTGNITLVKMDHFAEICMKEVKVQIMPDEDNPETREKAYEDEILSILYEAFIHAVVQKTVENAGLPTIVPQLFEVLGKTKDNSSAKAPSCIESVWIGMEFLSGYTLERYLEKHLSPVPAESCSLRRADIMIRQKNEMILIDVLIQLAHYLNILQSRLRFNHRDLKVNNIFVRYHDDRDSWGRTLEIPEFGTWKCNNDIVLIDFGFSCIACGKGFLKPRATLIGAGSYFTQEHDCMKFGRDLGQFLYSLHCAFPLQDYVSREVFDVLHAALVADKKGTKVDLMMGIGEDGVPFSGSELPGRIEFNRGIYDFLREDDVDVPGCAPGTFLTAMKKIRYERWYAGSVGPTAATGATGTKSAGGGGGGYFAGLNLTGPK